MIVSQRFFDRCGYGRLYDILKEESYPIFLVPLLQRGARPWFLSRR